MRKMAVLTNTRLYSEQKAKYTTIRVEITTSAQLRELFYLQSAGKVNFSFLEEFG